MPTSLTGSQVCCLAGHEGLKAVCWLWCRMMHKMPLKTDGSRLTVDLKALKQIVLRSGVVAFWA